MKSFDLMFSGKVLPKRDRRQVKRDFAQFFSIGDSALIEEIFSGKTVILRHNLDRKTAAHYFREISLLGGEASLVAAPKYRSMQRDALLIPDVNATSNSHTYEAHLPAETSTFLGSAGPPVKAKPHAANAQSNVRQITHKKTVLASRLGRQALQIEKIAQTALRKIDCSRQKNHSVAQQALAKLKVAEETATQSAAAINAALAKEKIKQQKLADKNRAELEQQTQDARAEQISLGKQMHHLCEEIRSTAKEDITKLKQLIDDRQKKMDCDIVDLEQRHEESKIKSECEIANAQKARKAVLTAVNKHLQEVAQKEAITQQQLVDKRNDIAQRRKAIYIRKRAKELELQGTQDEIEKKHAEDLSQVQLALSKVNRTTEIALNKLQNPTIAAKV